MMLDGERELAGVGFAGSYGNYMAANAAGHFIFFFFYKLAERLQLFAARALDRPAELLAQSVAACLATARGDGDDARTRFDLVIELCTTFDLAGLCSCSLMSGAPTARGRVSCSPRGRSSRTVWPRSPDGDLLPASPRPVDDGRPGAGRRRRARAAATRPPGGRGGRLGGAAVTEALRAACAARAAEAVHPEATAQLATAEAETAARRGRDRPGGSAPGDRTMVIT